MMYGTINIKYKIFMLTVKRF